MSDQNDTSERTFNQSGGISQYLRVYLSTPATETVALAGATNKAIGTACANVFGTDPVTVLLRNKVGTRKMVAASAFAAGAQLYGVASGKVDDTPNGNYEGVALQAAGGANEVVEVYTGPAGSTVQALGDGKVMVVGEVTLDGSNPTAIASGLTAVEAVVVTIKGTATPGLDPLIITADYGASPTVNLYAWKPTASGNVTLIASTDAARVVSYMIVGTM
jgi:hypothetical protein